MNAPVPRHFALVPCAGAGVRAGSSGPKQYVRIAGRAMVGHTLDALMRVQRLHATLVVLAPEDELFERVLPDATGVRLWISRRGGASRAASVAGGLEELRMRGAVEHDWVLVHDAARCLIQPEWVDRLIDACIDDEVGGLLALPLADTLKVARRGRVEATLSRAGKWGAQTPQMFRLGTLQRALAQVGESVTDDSSAIEAIGLAPRLVEGDSANIKVTWPADFAIAEALIAARGALT